jgi:hypothetical protein
VFVLFFILFYFFFSFNVLVWNNLSVDGFDNIPSISKSNVSNFALITNSFNMTRKNNGFEVCGALEIKLICFGVNDFPRDPKS